MILGLQIYLIEHYTKPGDTILDPMAGSGTILMACTLGRNVVLVELEDKFVKMQQDNYEKIKSLGPMLGFTMGAATILQGDARNLDGLLADNIICSPPYAESEGQLSADKFADAKNFAKVSSRRFRERKKKGHFASEEAILRSMKNRQKGCGENPNNISNLPYGEIKAVICSPPYAESLSKISDEDRTKEFEKLKQLGYKINPDSADNKVRGTEYSDNPNNIGNLPYGKADAIVTSPPYEEGGQGVGTELHPERMVGSLTGLGRGYGDNQNNIGNLKSENYLQAMLQVYRQCHRVLKPEGIMVLVTKNFIRDKKVIRLDLDTIKLCEQAGFKLKETLKRKLTQQSFWRTIYHNKYPDVEKIEYEDVLIFEKGV